MAQQLTTRQDVAPPPVMTSDQILKHLDSVHEGLPEPVRAALDHAHSATGGPGLSGVAKPVAPPPVEPMPPPSLGMVAGGPDQAASMLASNPAVPTTAPASSEVAPPPVTGVSMPMDAALAPPSVPQDGIAPAPMNAAAPDAAAPAPFPVGADDSGQVPQDSGIAPPPVAARTPGIVAPPVNKHAARLEELHEKGAGWHGIHNPFLKTLAAVGDVVGSGLFPQFGQFVPGTTAHNMLLQQGERSQLGEERAGAKSASDTAEAAARTDKDVAEAEAKRHPPGKVHDEEFFKAGDGSYVGYRDATGRIYGPNDADLPPGVKQVLEAGKAKPDKLTTPYEKWQSLHPEKDPTEWLKEEAKARPDRATPEGEIPLGKRVDQINKAFTARYQVLHPGAALPEHYILPAESTQKDFDRTERLLQGEESAYGNHENAEQTKALRQQAAAAAADARKDHKDTSLKTAVLKTFTPASDSAERFNVMAKNYEDAVNGDQQAMLSLLANHLGMTMGLQKGARLTKDIINEAKTSRPWLQGLASKFDKDGYLSGVTLTSPQMKQMLDLGRGRFSEDLTKARNESQYLGAEDDGPKRTPSASTRRFYLHEAGGDKGKAKQLAAADGWSE